jgi:hypothetical protein
VRIELRHTDPLIWRPVAASTHEGHAEAKEWADKYDPDTVDELPIKYALSRIANRRNAAKARRANKK